MATLHYWTHYRHARKMTGLCSGPILKYCPGCGFIPQTPFNYEGSRYGHAGAFTCEQCCGTIHVLDDDCRPPIRYAYDPPGHRPEADVPPKTIVYESLYHMEWADLQQVEAWTGFSLLITPDSGSFEVESVVEKLASHVQALGLEVQEAPMGLPFVTWVPEPFRQWLDLTHTLRHHAQH